MIPQIRLSAFPDGVCPLLLNASAVLHPRVLFRENVTEGVNTTAARWGAVSVLGYRTEEPTSRWRPRTVTGPTMQECIEPLR
jgi:hypothetical protein